MKGNFMHKIIGLLADMHEVNACTLFFLVRKFFKPFHELRTIQHLVSVTGH